MLRCYQLGLGERAEYAYLASRDRACYARAAPVAFRVPAPLDIAAEWECVLVDCHPVAFAQSFVSVQQRMPDAMERIRWVLGAVWTTDVPLLEIRATANLQLHFGWSQPAVPTSDYTPHHPAECAGVPTTSYHVASFTVAQLLAQFGRADFVVMDMEGAELPMLEAFLQVAPDITAYHIEAHSRADAIRAYELFDKNTYHVVSSIGRGNDRTEMQAVKAA